MEPKHDQEPEMEPPKERDSDGASEAADREHDAQQEQWRQAYLKQQRQRNCPGCGDGDEVF